MRCDPERALSVQEQCTADDGTLRTTWGHWLASADTYGADRKWVLLKPTPNQSQSSWTMMMRWMELARAVRAREHCCQGASPAVQEKPPRQQCDDMSE